MLRFSLPRTRVQLDSQAILIDISHYSHLPTHGVRSGVNAQPCTNLDVLTHRDWFGKWCALRTRQLALVIARASPHLDVFESV